MRAIKRPNLVKGHLTISDHPPLGPRYAKGEADPPWPPVTMDLKADFGAAGDGITDDSRALQTALDKDGR